MSNPTETTIVQARMCSLDNSTRHDYATYTGEYLPRQEWLPVYLPKEAIVRHLEGEQLTIEIPVADVDAYNDWIFTIREAMRQRRLVRECLENQDDLAADQQNNQ